MLTAGVLKETDAKKGWEKAAELKMNKLKKRVKIFFILFVFIV